MSRVRTAAARSQCSVLPRRLRLVAVLVVTIPIAASCVQAPRATVDASVLVEERIADLQVSHEAMLTAYFDLMRQQVERFLADRWIPVFLETFIDDALLEVITDPDVLTDEQKARLTDELAAAFAAEPGGPPSLERVVLAVNRTFGDAERGAVILLVARVANEEIDRQRAELLAPIQTLEREAIAELRASYVDVLKLQGSITGYLRSISDLTITRDAILDELGVLEQRDALLAEAVSLNDELETAIETGTDVAGVLATIRELLGLPPEPAPALEQEDLQRRMDELGDELEQGLD